jgi:hypothetical protein
MAFRLLGPDSVAAAIFENSQYSYLSKTLVPRRTDIVQIGPLNNDRGVPTVYSFLDLPPEIRLEIYKMILISYSTIYFQYWYHAEPVQPEFIQLQYIPKSCVLVARSMRKQLLFCTATTSSNSLAPKTSNNLPTKSGASMLPQYIILSVG